MACLASLYLLVSFGQWATLGYPNVSSVVDKLIADSDQGYASESVKGQLAIHHVLVIEACLSAGVDAALLYPENLTGEFFDLNSGEAGTILQKLRNYQVRLAVVCAQASARE